MGYSANGEVIIAQKDKVLSIPESCLDFEGDSAFVFIQKSDKDEKRFHI